MLLLTPFLRAPLAVAASALLLCVATPPVLAQPKAAPGTPLAECGAANRQAMAELTQELQASTKRHVASPMTISRLQALDASVRRLRDGLGRSGRSLAECEQMALGLAGERERLLRITGVAVPGGGGDAGAVPVSAVLAAASGAAAGPALPAAGTSPAATPASLLAPPLAPPPTSPAAAPAAVPAADPACREAAARSYNELAQVYAGLVQPSRLQQEWRVPLKAISERLTQLHASIAAAPAPGWDCALVTQGLAQARADLRTLAP